MNRERRLELLSAYLDGELSEADQRWLAAWSETHADDQAEFEALAEIVRLARELPQADPPAGLRDRILRACAAAVQVEVPRQQALEWLDKYFDGELPAPQVAVVEHYLAVDPDFAETAAVHRQMLALLADVEEVEPPRDLRGRIEADIERINRGQRPTPLRRPRRTLGDWLARPRVRALAAAAALVMVALAGMWSSGGQGGGGVVATDPEPDYLTPDQVPAAADQPAVDGMPLEVPVHDGDSPIIDEGMPAEPHVAPVPPRPDAGHVATEEREPAEPAVALPPAASTPDLPRAVPEMAPAPLPGSASGGELAGDDRSSALPAEARGNQSPGDDRLESRDAVDPTRRVEVPPF